jgi:hypothetical protein
MIAESVAVVSVIGLCSSIGERLITEQQREKFRDYEGRLQHWASRLRKINFSERIRQPRVLFAMSILPMAFVASTIWMFPKAIVGTILVCLALLAICAPLVWWLSRSGTDRIFVERFAIVTVAAFLIYQATTYWLVRDIEGADELLLFGPMVVASKIFFLLVFGFLFFFAFLPFIAAKLVSWLLRGADLYVHYCIREHRLAFMTLCAVSGAIAAAYAAVARGWF